MSATLASQGQPSPEALAKALQQRYQGSAISPPTSFMPTAAASFAPRRTERGTRAGQEAGPDALDLYRPGEEGVRLRRPEGVLATFRQDRQVIVSDVPPDDQATTPALFLAGKGDIGRDFTAAYADAVDPGTVALKLTPRRPEPEYEYLVVAVDPATLQMRALTTRDRQGGESTLTFSNLKENQGIPDKEFAFRIPRGVDVITDGTRK